MNNPLLESYYVAVFKYYAFQHLSWDIFPDVSSFSSISIRYENTLLKYIMGHHSTLFDILVNLLANNEVLKMRGQPCSGNQRFKN